MKIDYNELAKARVSESRNVVISDCSKGGFTVAQQLEVKEGEKTTSVFLKGAIHIDDIDGLYNFRDAINLAIKSAENEGESQSENEWDEE